MSGKSTKLTFQDLEVLKSTPDDDMYVFKVDLHQAEQIAHIVQMAPDSFSLAFALTRTRASADTSQYGTTTDRLIMTYLFPAPQLIDLNQLAGPAVSPSPGRLSRSRRRWHTYRDRPRPRCSPGRSDRRLRRRRERNADAVTRSPERQAIDERHERYLQGLDE